MSIQMVTISSMQRTESIWALTSLSSSAASTSPPTGKDSTSPSSSTAWSARPGTIPSSTPISGLTGQATTPPGFWKPMTPGRTMRKPADMTLTSRLSLPQEATMRMVLPTSSWRTAAI